MQILILLTTIAIFLVPALIITYCFKQFTFSSLKKHDFLIFIIGAIYTIFGLIFLFWSIGFFTFNITDFLIIYSLVMVIQTTCLIFILSELTKNPRALYLLLSLILIIPFVLIDISYIHLVIPISFLIVILAFLAFSEMHQKYISLLIIYSSLSLIFYIITFITTKSTIFLNLILTIIFLVFLKDFLKNMGEHIIPTGFYHGGPKSPIMRYIKHLIFIIIITNFIFIGTISVHELGHMAAAKLSNCEDTKIVYEMSGLPHTEVECINESAKQKWILGGILLPFLIAALLIFGGGKFIRELGFQIVGFNLIISYLDIQDLGLSKIIATFAIILGVFTAALSLFLLIKSRTEV